MKKRDPNRIVVRITGNPAYGFFKNLIRSFLWLLTLFSIFITYRSILGTPPTVGLYDIAIPTAAGTGGLFSAVQTLVEKKYPKPIKSITKALTSNTTLQRILNRIGPFFGNSIKFAGAAIFTLFAGLYFGLWETPVSMTMMNSIFAGAVGLGSGIEIVRVISQLIRKKNSSNIYRNDNTNEEDNNNDKTNKTKSSYAMVLGKSAVQGIHNNLPLGLGLLLLCVYLAPKLYPVDLDNPDKSYAEQAKFTTWFLGTLVPALIGEDIFRNGPWTRKVSEDSESFVHNDNFSIFSALKKPFKECCKFFPCNESSDDEPKNEDESENKDNKENKGRKSDQSLI